MPAGTRPLLSRLGEFGLIRKLQARFGHTGPSVVRGIGDDAAVIRSLPHRQLLVTTDLLINGVHFDLERTTSVDIGYKAAVANLSDIAAMGGTPHYLLVSIAIPASRTARDIERLYQGLMEACRPYDVQLIGGDTSASRQGLFISITLIGSVHPGHALTRDGARVGDLLFVTGVLGDSQAGLDLQTGRTRSGADKLPLSHRRYLIARHVRPSPRLRAGQILSSLNLASSAIDLSDGLAGDLRHLCEQSAVGAEVEITRLPYSAALQAYAGLHRKDPAEMALIGGEDYELLFTVHPSDVAKLSRLHRRLGCRFSCIGGIRAKRYGLKLRDRRGTVRPLVVQSYEHFHDGRHSKHTGSR